VCLHEFSKRDCGIVVCGMATGVWAQEGAPAKPAVKAVPLKAVKFGKLWDGKGEGREPNAIVIVEGERILEVTTDAKKIPAGRASD